MSTWAVPEWAIRHVQPVWRDEQHSQRRLYLGNNWGSSGSYNLSGSGVLSAGYEHVGQSGMGTFNQSGGTNTVTGQLTFAGTGTYNLTGGVLLVPGIQGTGTFNLGGGTIVVSAADSTSARS